MMGHMATMALLGICAVLGRVPAAEETRPGGARVGARDAHSFGNPEQIRVRHIALNLAADFQEKRLRGKATLTLERAADAPPDAPLVLDTRDLDVRSVIAPVEGQRREVPFEVGPADPVLGAPLRIALPEGVESIEVFYRTDPAASALQWVDPRGTAGGKQPFLYSQSQAIHARSWIPCQDSPGVHVTYEAEIYAPQDLTAVMSAESLGRQDAAQRFALRDPVPPYLIALAVGELEFRELGPRTGVWAEPSVVGRAAEEFADTEHMLTESERLFGPYRWGRYDLLVLPPSFPYGGMENARLSFVTPTVLAGDRSLVSLIAHEMAHSWAGNLVTCATWSDFWLNEGLTTYLERRIVEAIYGPERATMEAALGRQRLLDELATLDARDEVLHNDLSGRDPDAGFTGVPYEKGALFFKRLETAFGRERFDAFLRGYFDHFAFQSITTTEFVDYLKAHLFADDPQTAATIDLDVWLHEPGLPADAPKPESKRFTEVDQAARRWLDGEIAARELPVDGWGTLERLRFLDALPTVLPPERLAELDAAFDFTERANPEVAANWFALAIRSGYRPADARIEEFLTTVGRRKFLVPLYQALAATPEGQARARAIYAKARPRYHPIAVGTLDDLLGTP